MPQDHNSMYTYVMLSDRLREIENNQRHQISLQRDTRSTVHNMSTDMLSIQGQLKRIHTAVTMAIKWGQRILLAIGAVLMSSGHLTIDHLAEAAKKAWGL